MEQELEVRDILTVVRLNARKLGVPEFVLPDNVTKVAQEECVIFVLETEDT